MGWGLIRIAIFTLSFLIGLLFFGSGRSAAGSKISELQGLNQPAGAKLVVACGGGSLNITQLRDNGAAIQIQCMRGDMIVVHDKAQTPVVPEFHGVGM